MGESFMERAEGIYMSKKEEFTYRAVMDFLNGKLSRSSTAELLQIRERSVTRLARRIEAKGFVGATHGNRGSTPANKKPDELKLSTMKLVEELYYDFNMTHCLEKLKEGHGVELKYSVFRRWCHERHMVKRRKRRRAQARFKRTRMPNEGLLLQFDGSPHRWNNKDVWCLIGAIDDATSEMPWAEFFLAEDTLNCMTVMQRIIEKKGIPHAVYVDKAGWFGGQKRQMFSQFKRACEDLNIRVIFANSAQAKGRIERAWDTLQDRLIPEMRIRNIHRMPAANDFLQSQFLPNYWEQNNRVVPHSIESRYRHVPAGVDLNEIFCIKEHRTVKADHTLSWDGVIYNVASPLKYSIQKQHIEIRNYQNGTWRALFAGRTIEIVPAESAEKVKAAA
jgi:transposase